MRGALASSSSVSALLRIIPADAGSTALDLMNLIQTKDHPRGCGEHANMMVKVLANAGSSPRMRGAPALQRGQARVLGIIPADAGSTMG